MSDEAVKNSGDLINVVFVGHGNCGKSTLIGRMFMDLGMIEEKALKRQRKHARAVGDENLYLAFFMDKSLEERQRGASVEATSIALSTGGANLNLIDAPGHKDFVKNMITAAVEADTAVVVIDCESTLTDGIAEQAVEHIHILNAIGIDSLIFAVNGMDTAAYQQDKFEKCREFIENFLEEIAYSLGEAPVWIPVSALEGDNVVNRSEKMDWYAGPTALEALGALKAPARPVDAPLRMPVLRTFNIPDVGSIVVGRIETGRARPGDKIAMAPYPGVASVEGTIESIEWERTKIDEAAAGYYVGICLTGLDSGFMVRKLKKGSVAGAADDPPKQVEKFLAEIKVFNHPKGIKKGYSPYLHVHQAAMPCSIVEIVEAKAPDGSPKTIEGEERLLNGDTATVWIKPHKPLVIEEASRFPRLGRFVLRDGITVASGVCVKTE